MKHLQRIASVVLLGLSLVGCVTPTDLYDGVKAGWAAVTATQNVEITPKTVSVAGSAFDIAQDSGTAYLTYCQGETVAVCSTDNKRTVISSLYSGRAARNRLKACVRAGTCGLGASADYSAVKSATAAIQDIVKIWKGS